MKKKLFSVLTILTMIIGLFALPVTVNATEEEIAYKQGSFEWLEDETNIITPDTIRFRFWAKQKQDSEDLSVTNFNNIVLAFRIGNKYKTILVYNSGDFDDAANELIKDENGFVRYTGQMELEVADLSGEIEFLGLMLGRTNGEYKAYSINDETAKTHCVEIYNAYIENFSPNLQKINVSDLESMDQENELSYEPYVSINEVFSYENKDDFTQLIQSKELKEGYTYFVAFEKDLEEMIISKEVFDKINQSQSKFIFDTYSRGESDSYYCQYREVQWVVDGKKIDPNKTKDIDLATTVYLYNDKIQYEDLELYKTDKVQEIISTPISGIDGDTLQEYNQSVLDSLADSYIEGGLDYYYNYLNDNFDINKDEFETIFREEYRKHNSIRIVFENNGELPGEFQVIATAPEVIEEEYQQTIQKADLYYINDDGSETLVQSGIELSSKNWYELNITHNSTYALKPHKQTEIDVEMPSTQLPDEIKETTLIMGQDKDTVKDILSESANKDTEIKKAIEDAKNNGYDIIYSVMSEVYNEDEANQMSPNSVEAIKDFVGKNGTIAHYIDIDLSCDIIQDTLVTGYPIFETTDKLKFKVAIPKELQKDGRTFEIVRVHDDVEVIPSTYENGIISFESDKFSMFAVVYKDRQDTQTPTDPTDKPTLPEDTNNSENTTDNNPTIKPEENTTTNTETNPSNTTNTTDKTDDKVKTSDDSNVMLYASFAGLALVGGAIVVVMKKKEELLNK